ncbi:hypothetical protein V5799_000130 [Amblyomma americanum]|uniref:Chaperone DnaJ C-terminal domain-containing protein n=1 Tax=Amblyomma americanum TaxID=6943 RepID=A0AAQ4D3Y7_AMBAM
MHLPAVLRGSKLGQTWMLVSGSMPDALALEALTSLFLDHRGVHRAKVSGPARTLAGQWTKYRYGPGFSAPYSPSANPSSKFSTKYTAPGSTQKTQMKQNPAVEHNLDVTLFEVLHGCTKKMKVTRTVMSPDGRTSKREEKVLTINVKPGWKAGTKITFHREGDQIPGTIPADIVFIIRDKPHPLFKRVGADVHYQKRVSLEECL